MEYVALGHSGIQVSRVCLGGMSFGAPSADFHQWTIGPDETRAVIARAVELGVARDKVVLASKVYFNEGHLSREAIMREIDGTLSRLGTDYLDLYIIHRFDYDTPIEETMGALDELVRAGKVRALGASEMYAYQLHNMQVCAERNGWTKFTSMQCHYNLLYRESEREMIPVCRQFGMALTPYSPMASGHLCRPTWESSSTRATTDADAAQQVRRHQGAGHAHRRARRPDRAAPRGAHGAGGACLALGARRRSAHRGLLQAGARR